MRLFLAGATGAIGRRLVPKLVESGHRVTAITRSKAKLDDLNALGAEAVLCDVFDAGRLGRVVARAEPDAVINEFTDLPQSLNPRKLKKYYAANNRVRREGTANLLDAARGAGVRRFLVQSAAYWYAPSGGPVRTEEAPPVLGRPGTPGASRPDDEAGGGRSALGRLARGCRLALRVLLWAGNLVREERGHRAAGEKAALPDDRSRRGHVLLHPHRRRCRCYRRSPRARSTRCLQRRRRRTRSSCGVATGLRRSAGGEAAAPGPGVHRSYARRESRRRVLAKSPERFQREGKGGPRLAPTIRKLAAGVLRRCCRDRAARRGKIMRQPFDSRHPSGSRV